MFGRLTWDAIPFHEPIPLITSLVVLLGVAAIAAWITKIKAWHYLWHEYITSTDHKKIGIMVAVASAMPAFSAPPFSSLPRRCASDWVTAVEL